MYKQYIIQVLLAIVPLAILATYFHQSEKIPETIAAYATLLAVLVAIITIHAKRIDDRRNNRLLRISRQLSNLYGKLYILYEAGERHWNYFLEKNSKDNKKLNRKYRRFFPFKEELDNPISFFNPSEPDAKDLEEYDTWLKGVFIETNSAMLGVIERNADLIIGSEMPKVFTAFAEHVASLKILVMKLKDSNTKKEFHEDWNKYVDFMAAHPPGLMHLIKASFEVLKEEQEDLLSSNKMPLTEEEIAFKVKKKAWERDMEWRHDEQKERAKIGQVYILKNLPDKPKEKKISAWQRLYKMFM